VSQSIAVCTATDSFYAMLPDDYSGGNRLIDALPPSERDALLEAATTVHLRRREALITPGAPVLHVDFPNGAMISVVVVLESGETTEVGVAGRESFVPAEAVLGEQIVRRTAFCQVPGSVVRVPIATFRTVLDRGDVLYTLAQRTLGARLFTAEQLIACNASHALLARCARWLLTTRDRVGRDEFALTHEFMALMLGVRRAGVTQAAADLQRRGAIRYGRGHLSIVDDRRLSDLACECYAATREALDRPFALPALASAS